jgi:flavin-dependent dehydrogenase
VRNCYPLSDVIILGGGPAGSAAALELLKSGLSVTILEASRYTDRHAGDTLCPEARQWLGQLGVSEMFEALPSVPSAGIVALWDSREATEIDFLFNPYGNGWHLDRAKFDVMLAEAAERAGALLYSAIRLLQCGRTDAGTWRLEVAIEGRVIALESPWLIDATGRNRWFLHRQGFRPCSKDRLVAILARIDAPMSDSRLFIEARPEGWWYYAPLPGAKAVAAYMTDSDLIPRQALALGEFWERQRAASELISVLTKGIRMETLLRVCAANTSWAGKVAGHRWLAVGDAALAHDPLSGRGISQALASGWNAARAVTRASHGHSAHLQDYQAWAESNYQGYERARGENYGRVRHWPYSRFWTRRRVDSRGP